MNKRKRKKAEKRTVQYISKLRKTDKQAWRETMIRRRRALLLELIPASGKSLEFLKNWQREPARQSETFFQ